MSMKETQIHTNKYIEHFLNKLPTTSLKERHVRECTYRNDRIRLLEKAKTNTFFFKNVPLIDLVGL